MNKPRPCGCKGRRTCLLCENEHNLVVNPPILNKENGTFVYCPFCYKAWPGWDLKDYMSHPNHPGVPINFSGIYIKLDFLTAAEEENLIQNLDTMPWDLSQSGRRKQNFGPKCNFKKKRLRLGDFQGFPKSTKFVQDKFSNIPILVDYHTIEQCSLEYNPERGASIDPHIDDCWIWGERIVTVNLLADSVLTMTCNKNREHYNLDCVKDYPAVVSKSGQVCLKNELPYSGTLFEKEINYPIIRIPMPKRSLLVMYNSARYDWEHRVLREDIHTRRVCLAYREFTPPYLPGGQKHEKGKDILANAKIFW